MIDYSYLRPKKAAILEQWHKTDFFKKENLEAPSYKNATILPLRRISGDTLLFGRGGVITETGSYVESSAINQRVQFSYEHTVRQKIDEKVVYCGYLANQWGHFLVEAVARLWYFLRNDTTVDHYVFFVYENEHREVSGNYREFFKLLGVWDKLIFINQPTQYREVIVPELGYCWRTYYSDEFKAVFRRIKENVRPKDEWKQAKKIYFSRSQLKNIGDKEFGLEILDNYFKKNGYEVVFPEKLTLSQLLYLLENAEEVASLSGSLPHNLLFAEDGKKLHIVERNVLNNEIQADVNRIKNLEVTYVDANIPLYSINLGFGPFIMAYNNLLEKYTKDRGYIPADEKYRTKKYMKRLFIKYVKCYEREYRYQWFMEDWSIKYCDYLREGYYAGLEYYGEYLMGKTPFLLKHYFEPHYWKQFAKHILRR